MEDREEEALEPGAPRPTAAEEVGENEDGLLSEFRAWLLSADRAARAGPEPPSRVEVPDLSSFYGALIALREEVRRDARQSRRFLEEAAERSRAGDADLKTLMDEVRSRLSGSSAQAERRDLLELIELRDRAALGLFALEQSMARFRRRLRVAGLSTLFASLRQGQAMLVGRFDETLRARGVEVIPVRGQAFDPSRMKAVEVDRTPGAPEGTVTAELRAGYEREGVVLRPAEVCVARRES
ncbi:MAG: nucleotide exchange factor GrpE [Deltaproteobacteria bacterium]|nr:nucleotide exchange factor GrpE [Deltaproteobacteria bacterium]